MWIHLILQSLNLRFFFVTFLFDHIGNQSLNFIQQDIITHSDGTEFITFINRDLSFKSICHNSVHLVDILVDFIHNIFNQNMKTQSLYHNEQTEQYKNPKSKYDVTVFLNCVSVNHYQFIILDITVQMSKRYF